MNTGVEIEAIVNAAEKLKGVAFHTATQRFHNLSNEFSCDLFLKREDLQKVRSYKLRGAYHFMSSQDPLVLSKGVVCASAGNHAQGVAYCCDHLGVPGKIFMPSTTPKQKVAQVRMFGKEAIEIILTGDTFDDAYAAANDYCHEQGMLFIHPFDDQKIIEGQGTVAKEILDDLEAPLDYLFLPIGGGGLAAGVASYFKKISPKTKLIGVEPEGAASMKTALEKGEVVRLEQMEKFVDGAAVAKVGQLNFDICKGLLDQVISIPEGKLCTWILKLYSEEAIVVEPAGVLAVAALDYFREELKGKQVACVVSGSNNEIDRMQEIKERSLLYEGLKHYFIVQFPQRSGALREFLDDVLGPDDDITRFEYAKKSIREAGPAVIGIELKKKEDFEPLLNRLKSKHFSFKYLNDDPDLFRYFI